MNQGIQKIDEIIGDYKQFLDKITKNLEAAKINISDYELDHIAYRAQTTDSFLKLSEAIYPAFGKLIKEAIVRNRRISIIEFNEPIKYYGFTIKYFELMEPAQGDHHPEGLEHAEFVVGRPVLNNLRELHPEVDFIFIDRKVNPELILMSENNANIKFHPLNIKETLRLQELSGEL